MTGIAGPKCGPAAQQLLDAVEADIAAKASRWYDEKPATWASVKAVTQAADDVALELMQPVLAELGRRRRSLKEKDFLRLDACKRILQGLVKRPLDRDAAGVLLAGLPAVARENGNPSGTVVATVERVLADFPDDPALKASANELAREVLVTEYGPPTAEQRRLARRIEQALGTREEVVPEAGDPFGDAAAKELESMSSADRARWQPLLALALGATGSKPSKKLLAAAREAIEAVGEESLFGTLLPWFEAVRAPDRDLAWGDQPISVANGDLLRGLVWALATVEHPQKLAALGDLARRSLKKIPGHGPLCRKVGNACLLVLSLDGSRQAVQQLQILLQGTRYAQVRSLIEGFLNQAAERAGLSRGDLDDLSVPDFGLAAAGRAELQLGDFRAELSIASLHEVALVWRKAGGKTVKSVPKAVRESHPDAVKELKARVKEMKKVLIAQRNRIERFWIEEREWSAADLRERFLDHPFMAFFGRRLVWIVSSDSGATWTACCWTGDVLCDVSGEPLRPSAEDRVRLWHPILCDAETVLAWRRRQADLDVTQPVKQAHREVYVLTDAEMATDTYSNRFAAHILKQHQLHALCQERGWSYALQGNFDGHNVPERRLEGHALQVDFVVDAILESEAMAESGIALYVTTDQVRFRPEQGDPIPLRDVPPMLFSEVMREVDLFVGVASVGNDPNWVDGGEGWFDGGYWEDFAFGALSATGQTRREVLAELLPSLKIADRCTLGDRFLEVRGHYHSYKIHLGSGNIQIEPGSRYLCIVRAPRPRKGPSVKLPFEGDGVLSIILSKAMLLADDVNITDPAILSQIR